MRLVEILNKEDRLLAKLQGIKTGIDSKFHSYEDYYNVNNGNVNVKQDVIDACNELLGEINKIEVRQYTDDMLVFYQQQLSRTKTKIEKFLKRII
jgi:hypothetical protein